MKKITSILLILVLTFSFAISVFAEDVQNQDIKVTRITYDQYIKNLAEDKGITVEEAKKIDLQENKDFEAKLHKQNKTGVKPSTSADGILASTTSSDGYYYVDVSGQVTYNANANFKMEIDATVKCYSTGYYRHIVSVAGQSSRIVSGLNQASWVQSYAFNDPTTFPCTTITFYSVGYFTTTTTTSTGVSGGIPGFEVSGSVGSSWTYTSPSIRAAVSYTCY